MDGQFYSDTRTGSSGNPDERNSRGVMNSLIGETQSHEPTGRLTNPYPSHFEAPLDELAQANAASRDRTLASINNNLIFRQNNPNIFHPNLNGLPVDPRLALHQDQRILHLPENIPANVTNLQANLPGNFLPNLPIDHHNLPPIDHYPQNINIYSYQELLIQDLMRRRQQQMYINDYMQARNIAEEELMLRHLQGRMENNLSQNMNLSPLSPAEGMPIVLSPSVNTSALYEINEQHDAITSAPGVASQESTAPPPEDHSDMEIFACKARNMPLDHNLSTAYFMINPSTTAHGTPLKCSYPACRSQGVKFRYCAFCKIPAAKQNFLSRHRHCGNAK